MSKNCSTDQRFILKEITSLKIHTLPASFDILVYDVWCHGSNFDKAIVLNENGVTSEISMKNRWITSSMKIIESWENLSAPSFPRLNLDFPLVSLVFSQKLFQSSRGHEFGDKHEPFNKFITCFLRILNLRKKFTKFYVSFFTVAIR